MEHGSPCTTVDWIGSFLHGIINLFGSVLVVMILSLQAPCAVHAAVATMGQRNVFYAMNLYPHSIGTIYLILSVTWKHIHVSIPHFTCNQTYLWFYFDIYDHQSCLSFMFYSPYTTYIYSLHVSTLIYWFTYRVVLDLQDQNGAATLINISLSKLFIMSLQQSSLCSTAVRTTDAIASATTLTLHYHIREC